MMTNTNRDAIESLRNFAVEHCEIAFAHLCTSALNGEEWAAERVLGALDDIEFQKNRFNDATHQWDDNDTLASIRGIVTTRPDGATARSFKI